MTEQTKITQKEEKYDKKKSHKQKQKISPKRKQFKRLKVATKKSRQSKDSTLVA